MGGGRVSSAVPWYAELAQLVEQRFRKAWVAGSIPVLGSTGNDGFRGEKSEIDAECVLPFVCTYSRGFPLVGVVKAIPLFGIRC